MDENNIYQISNEDILSNVLIKKQNKLSSIFFINKYWNKNFSKNDANNMSDKIRLFFIELSEKNKDSDFFYVDLDKFKITNGKYNPHVSKFYSVLFFHQKNLIHKICDVSFDDRYVLNVFYSLKKNIIGFQKWKNNDPNIYEQQTSSEELDYHRKIDKKPCSSGKKNEQLLKEQQLLKQQQLLREQQLQQLTQDNSQQILEQFNQFQKMMTTSNKSSSHNNQDNQDNQDNAIGQFLKNKIFDQKNEQINNQQYNQQNKQWCSEQENEHINNDIDESMSSISKQMSELEMNKKNNTINNHIGEQYERRISGETSEQISEQTGEQASDQTGEQASDQTGEQMSDQTGEQMSDQTGEQMSEYMSSQMSYNMDSQMSENANSQMSEQGQFKQEFPFPLTNNDQINYVLNNLTAEQLSEILQAKQIMQSGQINNCNSRSSKMNYEDLNGSVMNKNESVINKDGSVINKNESDSSSNHSDKNELLDKIKKLNELDIILQNRHIEILNMLKKIKKIRDSQNATITGV